MKFRLTIVLTAALALAGLSATASPAASGPPRSFVSPSLLAKAHDSPNARVRVIVQGSSVAAAASAVASAGGLADGDQVGRKLGIVHAVVAEMKAKRVAKLTDALGLAVTPDGQVAATDLLPPLPPPPSLSSSQLWPYESGNAQLWSSVDSAPGMPTIAVVDSGIDTTAPDVAGRVIASVDLASATPNSPGDGRGHGTFVAGIAAGSAGGHAGAAPGSKLVSVDVLNDDGMGWTSDIIAGADWILAHKDQYGIRIANFSLSGSAESTFMYDPLDKAVERLWLSGVVVVAAAGNYGNGAQGIVKYSPANDPFVITVGAADLAGTASPSDDFAAPWSAYGFTYDGFRKPEVGASGRYMIGRVPTGSTLVSERPESIVSPGYMQLSGTSFAAPVVSGSAAHVLALHPEYTPDQVKGALMVTARPTLAASWSLGLGETDAVLAATVANPPNPNQALEAYVAGGTFDADAWQQAAQDNANWNQANWNQANWNSANWNAANWNSANWNQANWNQANWNSANWNQANWNQANWNQANWNQSAAEDAAREQAATGEAITGGYALTPEQAAALAVDPLLSPLP